MQTNPERGSNYFSVTRLLLSKTFLADLTSLKYQIHNEVKIIWANITDVSSIGLFAKYFSKPIMSGEKVVKLRRLKMIITINNIFDPL